MSAPPTEVVDRLERLAAGAPASGVDPDVVWARGRRRQRVRGLGALAAVLIVGLLGATTTPLLLQQAQDVEVADSAGAMVLPDLLREPGGWEPVFPAAPGRLSAVGFGQRSSVWSTRAAWWGVSATTGESRFLELPGAADAADAPMLSADGWRLAYWATGDVPGEPLSMGAATGDDVEPVVGVAVLDLRTGERDAWTVDSEHGLATGGLAWAGDVLWWSAGPISRSGESGLMGRDIVARTWDVTTDERDVSPRAAGRVTASPSGDAPAGFVEQLGARRVVVVSDTRPSTYRLRLPARAPSSAGGLDPTVSPDGERLAALLLPDYGMFDEARLSLLVGPVGADVVPLSTVDGVMEQSLAGWRSPTEVVVTSLADVEEGHPPQALQASVVDVGTGARTRLLDFSGNTPQVAADAWQAEVVPAPDPPFAPDPRLAGLVLFLGAFVVWRVVVTVRGRRGHP